MKKNTVSVVISAYNEEKYIYKCISSLLTQSLVPLEIIVIDDGSRDRTWDEMLKMRRVRSQIPLFIFKHKHLGQTMARNYGARIARGNILVFPDADMYFHKDYIRKLVDPIAKGKTIASFTKDEYIANYKNIWSQCWNINSYLPLHKRIPGDMPDKTRNFRAMKRMVFLKAGGFSDVGYTNDITVLEKLKMPKGGMAAKGAISYHNNPENILKIFYSARYIGRGDNIKKNVLNFLTYSFPNSIRRGIMESIKHNKPHFMLFKIVFDLGIFIGLMERILPGRHFRWK